MGYDPVERTLPNCPSATAARAASRSVLLRLGGLAEIISQTAGRPRVAIGLIDGVPGRDHPSLDQADITLLELAPDPGEGAAAAHATFLASMLVGRGERALGLCRNCRLLAVAALDAPLLRGQIPVAAIARRLAEAVLTALRGGADVILLPLDIAPGAENAWAPLVGALATAADAGVRTVIPAGNDFGPASPLLAAAGVVPVAASGGWAAPRRWGSVVARAGIAAPGFSIPGSAPGGGYTVRSGSSFAAAFVVAAFALLRSLRPDVAREALWSVLLDLAAPDRARGRIPALDAEYSLERLQKLSKRSET